METKKGKIEGYAGGGTYNIRTSDPHALIDEGGWARLTKAQAKKLGERLVKWSKKK